MASASVTDILQLLSSHADKKIDACNQVFADQMEWSAATVARIKEDFAVAVRRNGASQKRKLAARQVIVSKEAQQPVVQAAPEDELALASGPQRKRSKTASESDVRSSVPSAVDENSNANDEVVAAAAAPRNKRHQRTASTLDVPAPVAAVSTEPAQEVVSQANAPIAVDEVKSSKPASSGRKQLAKRSGQAAVVIAPEPTSTPAAVAAPAVIEVAAVSAAAANPSDHQPSNKPSPPKRRRHRRTDTEVVFGSGESDAWQSAHSSIPSDVGSVLSSAAAAGAEPLTAPVEDDSSTNAVEPVVEPVRSRRGKRGAAVDASAATAPPAKASRRQRKVIEVVEKEDAVDTVIAAVPAVEPVEAAVVAPSVEPVQEPVVRNRARGRRRGGASAMILEPELFAGLSADLSDAVSSNVSDQNLPAVAPSSSVEPQAQAVDQSTTTAAAPVPASASIAEVATVNEGETAEASAVQASKPAARSNRRKGARSAAVANDIDAPEAEPVEPAAVVAASSKKRSRRTASQSHVEEPSAVAAESQQAQVDAAVEVPPVAAAPASRGRKARGKAQSVDLTASSIEQTAAPKRTRGRAAAVEPLPSIPEVAVIAPASDVEAAASAAPAAAGSEAAVLEAPASKRRGKNRSRMVSSTLSDTEVAAVLSSSAPVSVHQAAVASASKAESAVSELVEVKTIPVESDDAPVNSKPSRSKRAVKATSKGKVAVAAVPASHVITAEPEPTEAAPAPVPAAKRRGGRGKAAAVVEEIAQPMVEVPVEQGDQPTSPVVSSTQQQRPVTASPRSSGAAGLSTKVANLTVASPEATVGASNTASSVMSPAAQSPAPVSAAATKSSPVAPAPVSASIPQQSAIPAVIEAEKQGSSSSSSAVKDLKASSQAGEMEIAQPMPSFPAAKTLAPPASQKSKPVPEAQTQAKTSVSAPVQSMAAFPQSSHIMSPAMAASLRAVEAVMVNAVPAATAAAAKQPTGPATVVPSKSKRTKDPEDDLGLFSPVPTRLGDLTMFTPPNPRSIQAAENAAAGVAALAALEDAKHQQAGHARDPAMALPSLSELVTQTSPNVKAAAPFASSNTTSVSAPQAAAAVDKNENILDRISSGIRSFLPWNRKAQPTAPAVSSNTTASALIAGSKQQPAANVTQSATVVESSVVGPVSLQSSQIDLQILEDFDAAVAASANATSLVSTSTGADRDGMGSAVTSSTAAAAKDSKSALLRKKYEESRELARRKLEAISTINTTAASNAAASTDSVSPIVNVQAVSTASAQPVLSNSAAAARSSSVVSTGDAASMTGSFATPSNSAAAVAMPGPSKKRRSGESSVASAVSSDADAYRGLKSSKAHAGDSPSHSVTSNTVESITPTNAVTSAPAAEQPPALASSTKSAVGATAAGFNFRKVVPTRIPVPSFSSQPTAVAASSGATVPATLSNASSQSSQMLSAQKPQRPLDHTSQPPLGTSSTTGAPSGPAATGMNSMTTPVVVSTSGPMTRARTSTPRSSLQSQATSQAMSVGLNSSSQQHTPNMAARSVHAMDSAATTSQPAASPAGLSVMSEGSNASSAFSPDNMTEEQRRSRDERIRLKMQALLSSNAEDTASKVSKQVPPSTSHSSKTSAQAASVPTSMAPPTTTSTNASKKDNKVVAKPAPVVASAAATGATERKQIAVNSTTIAAGSAKPLSNHELAVMRRELAAQNERAKLQQKELERKQKEQEIAQRKAKIALEEEKRKKTAADKTIAASMPTQAHTANPSKDGKALAKPVLNQPIKPAAAPLQSIGNKQVNAPAGTAQPASSKPALNVMSPPAPPKHQPAGAMAAARSAVLTPGTPVSSYEISDYEGSDADTPKPRKKIPLWARNPELEVALERQQFINPDSIFVTDPRVIGKVDLEEIFKGFSRGSTHKPAAHK